MNISTRELVEAKDVTAGLLEQLGLEAYLFDVEPRDTAWEVHVDCAIDGAWQSVVFLIDRRLLRASGNDQTARAEVLKDWGERLAISPRPAPTVPL